jgi:hypothetical protein
MLAHWPEIHFLFQKFRKCVNKMPENSERLENTKEIVETSEKYKYNFVRILIQRPRQ